MITYNRVLDLPKITEKNSFFLFGPRGTGKSFLIRHTLGRSAIVINLLKTTMQIRLAQDPSALEGIIAEQWPGNESSGSVVIVIDEIQKIPILLDEVHRLIEEKAWRFLLTGSSARRLKSSGVNLLGGRAWIAEIFPLTFAELPKFDLDRYLRFGGLPAVVNSEDPEEQLDAYVQTYINDEIKAEALVRKIPAFVEFLRIAALTNGNLINFANIAKDAGVSPPTIASYYQILEDTLVGFQLSPWKKPTTRKAIATSRFYFFDPGVVNTLTGTRFVERNSNIYGSLFEQWIAMELRAYLSYHRIKRQLFFWRTEDDIEVDFVVEGKIAVEVKASKKIGSSDLKGLKVLQEEGLVEHYYVISNDPVDRLVDQIHILHWRSFMTQLWAHKIITGN